MRLLVTTINRQCPVDVSSGFVYELDVEAGRVDGRAPVPEAPMRALDPNPRGGMRGGRGIAFDGESLFIANFSVIHRYDRTWHLQGVYSNPLCSDVHEIAWHKESLWACSTRNDSLAAFNRRGDLVRRYDARSWGPVKRALRWVRPELSSRAKETRQVIDFRDPTSHLKAESDGSHLNAVCFLANGDMLVSLGLVTNVTEDGLAAPGTAAVVRLAGDGRPEVLLALDAMTYPIHNLVVQPDQTVLSLDTTDGSLLRFNVRDGVVLSRWKLSRSYLRGVCRLPDGRLAVGAQNHVLVLDPARCIIERGIHLSGNDNESVHSIHALPPAFASLPPQLETAPVSVGFAGPSTAAWSDL
jgi:hypothetical protein